MPGTQRIENPFPHFVEAVDAAAKFVNIQRDLFKISAELEARKQAKRAAYFGGAFVLLTLTLMLTLFWITTALNEAGMDPWALAGLCFGVLGAFTGLFVYLAVDQGKK